MRKSSQDKRTKKPGNLFVRLLREIETRWKETPGGILNKLTIFVLPKRSAAPEADRPSPKDLMTGGVLYSVILLAGAWLLWSGWKENHFGPFLSGIFAMILGLLGIYGTLKK